MLCGSFYACAVVELRFVTERKKKEEKNEAEFIPRELPSERPSNKRQTFDTNIFCHCSMPECWDDMVQCELCEEWLHMSYEGFKTAPGTLNVFVIVMMLFRIPQRLIFVKIRK